MLLFYGQTFHMKAEKRGEAVRNKRVGKLTQVSYSLSELQNF
jgi:hypothetical protein